MIKLLSNSRKTRGWRRDSADAAIMDGREMFEAFLRVNSDIYVVDKNGSPAIVEGGEAFFGQSNPFDDKALPILGYAPSMRMEDLGDCSFCQTYGLKYPMLGGSMANGICSTDIVEAMGKNGMLAFFGAAGLSLNKVEAAIDRVEKMEGSIPFGFNLIHSPNEPDHEAAVVDLYLRRNIRLVEASAYLGLTLPVVQYRVSGIYRDAQGEIVTPNRIIAKASRVEVATQFFAPPPDKFLKELTATGAITNEQADLAREIPMAHDVTAESDSGGHTDNRPAVTLLPAFLALKEQMQSQYGYKQELRVGAAGGVASPSAVAAMFSMGAAYVVTGTVNQSCIEAGTSDVVREMLANSRQADIAMAPAADMFEMGVKVQVLKRGTMFPMRAAKLYELYCDYDGVDSIPASDREMLESKYFCDSLDNIWAQTCQFFANSNPRQITKADSDPKHKLALIFRWYLGQSSGWANSGNPARKFDYQVWCGPAMGAFNEWVKGSFLEDFKNRNVAEVAFNLLFGAVVNQRLNALRLQGFSFPSNVFRVAPLELDRIKGYLVLDAGCAAA